MGPRAPAAPNETEAARRAVGARDGGSSWTPPPRHWPAATVGQRPGTFAVHGGVPLVTYFQHGSH